MPNRHLDRVLAPGYLDGLNGWPIETIRERRSECQCLEDAASYLRRMVQTRIDILGLEMRNRTAGDTPNPGSIVDQLKELLSDNREQHSANGRFVTEQLREDQENWAHRRILEACAGHDIEESTDFSDSELNKMTEALVLLERNVSQERRALHDIFDRLQAELIERYKSGRATVDGLLR
jgi:hypothetical protein